MSDIDLFDLFNIEHQENILDIFDDIKTYCSNNNLKINIDKNYGDFFKLVYDNIDVEQSSEYLDKYNKIENEELLIIDDSEMFIECDEYY